MMMMLLLQTACELTAAGFADAAAAAVTAAGTVDAVTAVTAAAVGDRLQIWAYPQ